MTSNWEFFKTFCNFIINKVFHVHIMNISEIEKNNIFRPS